MTNHETLVGTRFADFRRQRCCSAQQMAMASYEIASIGVVGLEEPLSRIRSVGLSGSPNLTLSPHPHKTGCQLTYGGRTDIPCTTAHSLRTNSTSTPLPTLARLARVKTCLVNLEIRAKRTLATTMYQMCRLSKKRARGAYPSVINVLRARPLRR